MKVIIADKFVPVSNTPPDTFLHKIKFYGRMLLDLQILTIYDDLKKELPAFRGKVLDIGCGQSPYKFLLNKTPSTYCGIDTANAKAFNYHNPDVILFDGQHILFPDDTFDAMICTEVLEHVYNFQALVDEMYRVCKPGGRGIITIPFSARYHYIPNDYFRYTPAALEKIFSAFSQVSINPRGTDVQVIASKIIVLFARNIIPDSIIKIIFLPIWIALLPILLLVVMIAHICRLLKLGSVDDPLGYTVRIRK